MDRKSIAKQKARLSKLRKQAAKAKANAESILSGKGSPSFLRALVSGVGLETPPQTHAEYLAQYEAVKETREKQVQSLLNEAAELPHATDQNWDVTNSTRIGIIADEFLFESLEIAAEFIPITPDAYESQLNELDLLLVVSTWRGLNNEWQGVAQKNSELRVTLETKLIPLAKERGIPVAFYSKEDPPNYSTFVSIAKLADFVFTSAEEMIPKYKEEIDGEIPISSLRFAVNYQRHNPLGCQRHSGHELVFAGSWMSHKYPERAEAADKIFEGILDSGNDLILLDRNLHLDPKKFKKVKRYEYPNKYIPYLHAPLDHDKVQRIQKLLPLAINLNSVVTSQTMFANRVVELLAMGTLVLSNYSAGVNSRYPSVSILDSTTDVKQLLETLTPEYISYCQVQGIRETFLHDTAFDRLKEVLDIVGLPSASPSHNIFVVSESHSEFEAFKESQETEFELNWLSSVDLPNFKCESDGDLLIFIDNISIEDPNIVNDLVAAMRYSDADEVELLTFNDPKPAYEYRTKQRDDSSTHAYWVRPGSVFDTHTESRVLSIKTNAFSEVQLLPESDIASEPEVTVIVPIYNNGPHLVHKCFASLLRSSIFKNAEILLIDDGSTNKSTKAAIKMLTSLFSNAKSFTFPEGGSGSASRPRNKGLELTRTQYVTYLDPDNEQTNDAYAKLLNLVKKGDHNFAIGNMIRFKGRRSTVNNSRFLRNALAKAEPMNGQNESLLKTLDYKPMSIQALVADTEWLKGLGLKQPEGAVGQDSYFFQQMLFYAKNIATTTLPVHIYYAEVANSTVNSISPKFYRKYLPLESARAEWLRQIGLIDHYCEGRFKNFLKLWYIEKLKYTSDAERDECIDIIEQIVELYGPRAAQDPEVQEILREARTDVTI